MSKQECATMQVDPLGLHPGVYHAHVSGIDCESEAQGPLFRCGEYPLLLMIYWNSCIIFMRDFAVAMLSIIHGI